MDWNKDKLRLMITGILLMGQIGLGTELLLLGHYEGFWQIFPLGLLLLSIICVFVHLAVNNRWTLRSIQTVMGLLLGGGLIGLFFHYKGNLEFELEMEPDLSGLKLFLEVITGATPALAPGAFIQLGLLGLVSTYHHPAGNFLKQPIKQTHHDP